MRTPPQTCFRGRVKGPALVADDGRDAVSRSLRPGAVRLSDEETAALTMMTDGLRSHEIADALNLTVRSFHNVRRGLFGKLGARTHEHAASIAFRRGILQTDRQQGRK